MSAGVKAVILVASLPAQRLLPCSLVPGCSNRQVAWAALISVPGAGDRQAAVEAYKATLEKTAGVGLKMDIVLSMLRCAACAAHDLIALS